MNVWICDKQMDGSKHFSVQHHALSCRCQWQQLYIYYEIWTNFNVGFHYSPTSIPRGILGKFGKMPSLYIWNVHYFYLLKWHNNLFLKHLSLFHIQLHGHSWFKLQIRLVYINSLVCPWFSGITVILPPCFWVPGFRHWFRAREKDYREKNQHHNPVVGRTVDVGFLPACRNFMCFMWSLPC